MCGCYFHAQTPPSKLSQLISGVYTKELYHLPGYNDDTVRWFALWRAHVDKTSWVLYISEELAQIVTLRGSSVQITIQTILEIM
ncbi:hypothetical protein RvY_15618 [Ramazzottius varieornatus]|uniref:Uncharacterized protein n=1 Tax=Ramazzottius varieornatus TaxID=947166 RepID=A0A1D1VYQ8_RAMVA|nr:hypothetical protein RvY_15618 [Ramazzottius varieornatus]